MPITPAAPYPKTPGDPIRSQDWNQAVDEVVRLDTDKVDRAGDTVTGDLTVGGDLHTDQNLSVDDSLNVGADATFNASLSVSSNLTVGGATHQEGRIRLFVEPNPADAFVSHAIGTEAFHNRYGAGSSFPNSIGHRFYRGGGELIAQLGFGGNGTPSTRLTSQFEGDVNVRGDLFVPKTAGGDGRLSNATFSNETSLSINNLKLIMGHSSLFTGLTYEFMVGHTQFLFGLPPNPSTTNFVRNLAVNQNGDVFVRGNLTVGGSKSGYVVDHFINRANDALEQGDVVVVSGSQRLNRSMGVNNDIPMPEVDLTDKAYDTAVCGIVAHVVTDETLPLVEDEAQQMDPEVRVQVEKLLASGEITEDDLMAGRGLENVAGILAEAPNMSARHPLERFAARAGADLDKTRVEDKQLGHMVTLGCFAHCKVDASITAIQPGDLLTTSSTRGHAQKVEDPAKAVGAIIGKALAPLRRGQGKIPVLVMMQ